MVGLQKKNKVWTYFSNTVIHDYMHTEKRTKLLVTKALDMIQTPLTDYIVIQLQHIDIMYLRYTILVINHAVS